MLNEEKRELCVTCVGSGVVTMVREGLSYTGLVACAECNGVGRLPESNVADGTS